MPPLTEFDHASSSKQCHHITQHIFPLPAFFHWKVCEDVDECLENPFVCLHGRCRNMDGAYVCECQPGFSHSADGGYCMDENECATLVGTR